MKIKYPSHLTRSSLFLTRFSSKCLYTLNNAVANNKVQAYLSYYDSSPAQASQRKYKYVSSADLEMDDTKLRKGKGYWMYANEAGNLTLPGVGGSYSNETFAWSRLRFANGTDEKSITEVQAMGDDRWVQPTLQYWGWNGFNYYFLDINEVDEEYLSKSTISSWEGVFIRSNKDNITLIRQN